MDEAVVQQHRRQLAARGVAEDADARAIDFQPVVVVAAPFDRPARLRDDLRKRRLRRKTVIDRGDRNAERDEALGEEREVALVHAPPVAAVKEDGERAAHPGRKEIELFERRFAVFEVAHHRALHARRHAFVRVALEIHGWIADGAGRIEGMKAHRVVSASAG